MNASRSNQRQLQVVRQLGSIEACFHLLEYCPNLTWASNTTGEYIYLNRAWLEFTGHTLEEELALGWTAEIYPQDRELAATAYTTAFEARQPFELEYRRQRQDGDYRWLLHTGQPWLDQSGYFVGYVGNCIDITERKQRELELIENSNRHQAILAAIPDLIDLVDAEGILHDLVAPNYPMSLIPPEVNYINRPLKELIPLEVANQKLEAIQHTLEIQQIYTYEQTIEMNGQQEYEEVRCVPMPDNRVLSLVRNISDRKRSEHILMQYERMVNCTADGVALLDRDFVFLFANQTYLDWHQKTVDQVKGHPVRDVLGADLFDQQLKPRLDRCLQGETVRFSLWFPYRNQPRFLNVSYVPFRDETEQIIGVLASLRDVTELKQTEQALAESEDLFRSIYEQLGVGIALCTADMRIAHANQRYCELTGYTEAELQQMQFTDLTDPEVVNQNIALYDQLIRGETKSFQFEKRYIRKDGSRIWVNVTATIIRNESGQVKTIVGIVQDIDDRKQAEAALQISEAQFRAIFENAGIGIVTALPPSYQMAVTNPFFQSLVGYSAAELQQTTEQQITHPDDLKREQQLMDACGIGDEEYYRLEKRYVCRDGQVIWASVGKSVIRNQSGQIQQIVTTVEDITERKRAIDLEIGYNRRLKEAIFEEATDAVFLVDAKTRHTVNCNSRAVELFEAESKLDLIGFEGNELQVKPFSEAELAGIRDEVNHNGFSIREVEYQTQRGNTFWGRLSVKPIQMVESALFLVQVSDISDRKQAELDMIRNMEELRRLNLSKDDFLSTVSHELRTPLTSIKMASKMLSLQLNQSKANMDWQRIQSYLQILEEQCQQEDALINDLLDLQRLKADTYTLNLRLIPLQDWLPPILRGFEERIEQHQQQFRLLLPADFPPITSDPTPLQRIVVELLNNACKYTPVGEQIIMELQLLPTDETLSIPKFQLSICNFGIEISAADQPHIFEPFYRAYKGDRWAKAGTGLGLALVQQLVDQLGGTIECYSGAAEITDEGAESSQANRLSDSARLTTDDPSDDSPAVKTCFTMTFPLHVNQAN